MQLIRLEMAEMMKMTIIGRLNGNYLCEWLGLLFSVKLEARCQLC